MPDPVIKAAKQETWISDVPLCSDPNLMPEAVRNHLPAQLRKCTIKNARRVYEAASRYIAKTYPKIGVNIAHSGSIANKLWQPKSKDALTHFNPFNFDRGLFSRETVFFSAWNTVEQLLPIHHSVFHQWKVNELDKVKHPFSKLAFYFDARQLEDLRSLRAFGDIADDPSLIKHLRRADNNKKRRFTLVYPGAGSNMSPLLTVFKLLEKKRTDGSALVKTATVVYTDINPSRFKRTIQYLSFMQKKGMIKDLKETSVIRVRRPGKPTWVITDYSFKYKGKRVVFRYDLNGSHDLWASEADISAADLIVDHDSYNSMKITKKLLWHLSTLSWTKRKLQLHRPKKRFVLMAHYGGILFNALLRMNMEHSIIAGSFGCGSHSGFQPPRLVRRCVKSVCKTQRGEQAADPFNKKYIGYHFHDRGYNYHSVALIEVPLNHIVKKLAQEKQAR